MNILAQQAGGDADVGFFDEELLDEFRIPVGEWADQAVDWIATRLELLLDIIKWPFSSLIGFLVEDILEPVSWVWVVLAFLVIGTLVRGVKVGLFSAGALALCGVLGVNLWFETARTIGYIGVAVFLCAVIGLPLGIACGRVDGVWRVTRPVLDGMQVIHSFVYMLPFIFFWGIGPVSATMVTMVFALPPLVRLTNLGIRQVREDVVEASRAYGAPERRVLFDVQLPLARTAIATGINQTLLLAISMLGIAAIMGAGGLGSPLLKSITDQSPSKGAATGLAFFLVAVVLDRISQPEGAEGSLARRIRLAWAHRRDPEKLIPNTDAAESEDTAGTGEVFAPVSTAEKPWIIVAGLGGLIAVISVFLTWNTDAGFISAYGRRIDEELLGQSFSGWSASGGSWFGFLTFALGLWVLGAAAATWFAPGRGPRYLTTDGAVIGSCALVVMMVCYALASPSDLSAPEMGGGVWLAIAGGLVAVVGALMWSRRAPHSALKPLSLKVGWGRVLIGGAAVIVLVVGMLSAWSFDKRSDQTLSDETLAQIEELRQRAVEFPAEAGPIGAQIATLSAQVNITELVITDGLSAEGAGLGIWTLIAGLIGAAVALAAAGLAGRDAHLQWRLSALVAGIGAGVSCTALGWIATHVRSADPNYLSGVGSFLALCGGVMLVTTSAGALKVFRRSKVYADAVSAGA